VTLPGESESDGALWWLCDGDDVDVHT
jgi:hypothetical protein